MATLTVTARGQVTFRKNVLQHLAIKPGEKMDLHLLPDGRCVLRADRQTGRPEQLLASSDCSRAGPPKSPPLKKSTQLLRKVGLARNEGRC